MERIVLERTSELQVGITKTSTALVGTGSARRASTSFSSAFIHLSVACRVALKLPILSDILEVL